MLIICFFSGKVLFIFAGMWVKPQANGFRNRNFFNILQIIHFRSSNMAIENIEKTFINETVQELLKKISGLDLKNKIFAQRPIPKQQRSHFALMTDNMFQNVIFE